MDYTRLVLKEKKLLKELTSSLQIIIEPTERIEVLRALIHNLQFNQPEIARDYAQELLDIGLQKRNEETLGIACNVFAISEIQHGDFRKAQLYCYQALDALSDKSEPFIITCRNLAEILTNQGKYDEAYDYILLSEETQAYLGITTYQPFTNTQIAKIYYRKGKYKEAFNICLDNLRTFANHNPLDGWEAATYHVMGLIYAARKEYNLSLDKYLQSVKIWKKLNNPYQITGLYSNIGSSYIYQKNLILAEEYFQKALEVDKAHGGNTKMQSLIYQNLAIINFRSKKIDQAKSYYDMALRMCKMINDKLGEMQLLFNMAMMYENDPQEAIRYYENSLKIATDIQDTRFILYNNENLSEIYAKLKDYQKAYFYKANEQKLERELFGMEKTKAIKEVESQYNSEWQAKELELLQGQNESLKKFVQQAANKIEEPLRIINSFGQVLSRRYRQQLGNKGQEYLNHITNNSDFLGNIIRDLVDYAIISVDVTNPPPVDANDCLIEAIKHLKVAISDTNSKIFATALPMIRIDSNVLTRIFQSLIENAIKFRKDTAPNIEINTDENFNNIIISIKDNGIGIAPTDIERVIEVFEKIHPNNSYNGNGIGLAICSKVMKSIKGELWIESILGEGTTVFLKFPK